MSLRTVLPADTIKCTRWSCIAGGGGGGCLAIFNFHTKPPDVLCNKTHVFFFFFFCNPPVPSESYRTILYMYGYTTTESNNFHFTVTENYNHFTNKNAGNHSKRFAFSTTTNRRMPFGKYPTLTLK